MHGLQPAITIGLLVAITFYFYAIAGMQLFGDAGTDHDFYNENQNFLSFSAAVCLLTQVRGRPRTPHLTVFRTVHRPLETMHD